MSYIVKREEKAYNYNVNQFVANEQLKTWRCCVLCKERELDFSIFIIYSLAEAWNMSPATVYGILNTTGIFDDYIITCYDTLHTLGKEYLIEDITEYAREKGVAI